MNLGNLKPDKQKALFFAKRQLSVLVWDAVNLEGINYTLPEIQTLLDGVTVGGHKLMDETIALNQAAAWRFLFTAIADNSFDVSREFVCRLHALVAREESLTWGQFRDGDVSIAGTTFTPPDSATLDERWHTLSQRQPMAIKADTESCYREAISLFLQIARNQFFYDGNKRTGRIMMAGILLNLGLPIINLPAARQTEFNTLMLEFYDSNDEQKMQTFMLSCLDPKELALMEK